MCVFLLLSYSFFLSFTNECVKTSFLVLFFFVCVSFTTCHSIILVLIVFVFNVIYLINHFKLNAYCYVVIRMRGEDNFKFPINIDCTRRERETEGLHFDSIMIKSCQNTANTLLDVPHPNNIILFFCFTLHYVVSHTCSVCLICLCVSVFGCAHCYVCVTFCA